MTEQLTITTERVDDIPILLAQLDKMQIANLIDEYFPTHGNWQGLSLGAVITGWLTFILSEANHRLSHVQPWAAQRLTTLQTCLAPPTRALDFSDDRLAAGLDYLSEDASWERFERALGERTVRVYDLRPQRVRVDSTTAPGHVQISPAGLFQFGHSKDHRPDLPQVKINLSALDPLGLPLTTTVVPGQTADDPLYVPEIKRVQQTLQQEEVTYIGDCKMAALTTRAYLVSSGNYYLCPLSGVQIPPQELTQLVAPVQSGHQVLTAIFRPAADTRPEPEQIAEGYEYTVELTAQTDTGRVSWSERRLVVRSLKLAEAQRRALTQRVQTARRQIAALNDRKQGKKLFTVETDLRQAAEKVLTKLGVEGLVRLSYHTDVQEQGVRRYGPRPATVRQHSQVSVSTSVAAAALEKALGRVGWRVYATNQSTAQLPIDQVVNAYRAEYLIERSLGRLKGHPLSLTPLYLETEQRVTGLIRLLTIGLRVLTLSEFVVRRQLREEQSQLQGLYPGNPTRATAQPTSELLLGAFAGLTLTRIARAGQAMAHLPPLTNVQRRILELLGLSPDIYLCLTQHCSKASLQMSEP